MRTMLAGVVYEKNGVVVTAFEVDHGDLVKPALRLQSHIPKAYRSDFRVIRVIT